MPAPAEQRRAEVRLEIDGMTGASCALRIERRLNRLGGVQASVNLAAEDGSEHPLGRAIADGARARLGALPAATGSLSRTGLGVEALVDGHERRHDPARNGRAPRPDHRFSAARPAPHRPARRRRRPHRLTTPRGAIRTGRTSEPNAHPCQDDARLCETCGVSPVGGRRWTAGAAVCGALLLAIVVLAVAGGIERLTGTARSSAATSCAQASEAWTGLEQAITTAVANGRPTASMMDATRDYLARTSRAGDCPAVTRQLFQAGETIGTVCAPCAAVLGREGPRD